MKTKEQSIELKRAREEKTERGKFFMIMPDLRKNTLRELSIGFD